MHVLLTGSSGFIGSNLLIKLLSENISVELLSRHNHKNLKTTIIDFDNLNSFNDLYIDKSIDVVFHLAGYAHDVKGKNSEYYNLNTLSTISLAKKCLESRVKKFIFVSSIKAANYNNSNQNQINSRDLYAKGKREAELGLLEVAKNSSMQVVILRPALIYGPNVKGNLELMLSGIKNGWFPPLPNMNDCHFMVHIDDVVSALLKLTNQTENIDGKIFCITDGVKYSARDIYHILRSVCNKPNIRWTMPKFMFNLASFLHPAIKRKINKLFQNECYDYSEMDAIEFFPTKQLKDINETNI